MTWHKRNDFEQGSVIPHRCFVYNRKLDPDEHFIFRLGDIQTERGYLDICPTAVREMAASMGMATAEELDKAKDEAKGYLERMREMEGQVNRSRLDVVVEIATKLDSERRKTRRYRATIEELNRELGRDSPFKHGPKHPDGEIPAGLLVDVLRDLQEDVEETT